jgi:hypothetical protein
MARTKFFSNLGGVRKSFDTFKDAAAHWDQMSGAGTLGGIELQVWSDSGVMTRDAWLVHVRENGVYVHPNALDYVNAPLTV